MAAAKGWDAVVEYCDAALDHHDELDIETLENKMGLALDEDDERVRGEDGIPNGKLNDALGDCGWNIELKEFDVGMGPEGDAEKLRELRDLIADKIKTRRSFVEIKFCPQCNNMLYPKEDKKELTLQYWCKICQYAEPAEDPCVYINSVTQDLAALDQVTKDLATDPTLAHSGEGIVCPNCDHDDAVQFQTPIAREKSNMRLYYVCTAPSCRHKWAGDIDEDKR